MEPIDSHITEITDLCRRHKVRSLAVFGSILTDRFNENSDVDFLVDFEPIDHDTFDYVSNYFSLRDSLKHIFARSIDLIEDKGLRNKYVVEEINRTKRILFGNS